MSASAVISQLSQAVGATGPELVILLPTLLLLLLPPDAWLTCSVCLDMLAQRLPKKEAMRPGRACTLTMMPAGMHTRMHHTATHTLSEIISDRMHTAHHHERVGC